MGFDPNDGTIRALFSRDELRIGEILIDNREKRRLERLPAEKRGPALDRLRSRPHRRVVAWSKPIHEVGRSRRKRREARLRASAEDARAAVDALPR